MQYRFPYFILCVIAFIVNPVFAEALSEESSDDNVVWQVEASEQSAATGVIDTGPHELSAYDVDQSVDETLPVQRIREDLTIEIISNDNAKATSHKEDEIKSNVNVEAAQTTELPVALPEWRRNHNWLLSLPADHYTIQLVGVSAELTLRQFIARHSLQQKTVYYITILRGGLWYSLIYGDYPDYDSAKAAVLTLPTALQKDTWMRPLREIHNDIRRYHTHKAQDIKVDTSGQVMPKPAVVNFASFAAAKIGPGSIYLQVGAFWNRHNAQNMSRRLQQDWPGAVHISYQNNGDDSLYHVQVGPFSDVGAILVEQEKLNKHGIDKTHLIAREQTWLALGRGQK